jgi:hypothetical protein
MQGLENPMINDTSSVIATVRNLVASMTADERLAVIQAIAAIERPPQPSQNEVDPRQQALLQEQKYWFQRPVQERRLYANEYVAIYKGDIVDHDPDQRTLYLRVRKRFGRNPVLIVNANFDAIPEYKI